MCSMLSGAGESRADLLGRINFFAQNQPTRWHVAHRDVCISFGGRALQERSPKLRQANYG